MGLPWISPIKPASGIRVGSLLLAGLLSIMVAGPTAGTALAQSGDLEGLINRIDRLQRELQDLQRTVYKGAPPPESSSLGDSGLTPTQAAGIELRLSQFESALQSVTGQVEDLNFTIQRVNARLDGLERDLGARLQRLERQGVGPAAGVIGQQPGSGYGEGALAQPGQAGAGGEPAQPGVIGSIRQDDLQAFQSSQPEAVTLETGAQPVIIGSQEYALPGDTPEEQYNHAFSLLRQANYGEAELALNAFVARNPDHGLAGNAKYWLGETYYVRGDYQQSAITFAEGYQQYPNNTKAPDNLLKLGMSLGSLNAKDDACGTFAELLRRYPNASAAVLQKARLQRQKLACP